MKGQHNLFTCKLCRAISKGVSFCLISRKGLAGVNSSVVSLHNAPASFKTVSHKGRTRIGTLSSLMGLLTLCVPTVILYEYLMS